MGYQYLTHAPVFAWQKVVAITKKVGKDVGGFWISNDGAKSWIEKTQSLSGGVIHTCMHSSTTLLT